jgi:hypothetical protein
MHAVVVKVTLDDEESSLRALREPLCRRSRGSQDFDRLLDP